MLAAATTLATPVFLLSATTIMCDVAMLCTYVWAVWFWVGGMKSDRIGMLAIAAVLIAVSTLTKYFGVTLFPLLIAYGFMLKRRPASGCCHCSCRSGFCWHSISGPRVCTATGCSRTQPVCDERAMAAGRADDRGDSDGLAFTGGCCATIVFLIGVIVPRRVVVAGAITFVVVMLLLLTLNPIAEHAARQTGGGRWWLYFQVAFWAACGCAMFATIGRFIWSNRSAETAMLACWIVGTFCFAIFVNWNVAARSILPMAPAAAIVAAQMWTRRLESESPSNATWRPWLAAAPGAALAVLVCAADASLARTQFDAAVRLTAALAEGRIVRIAPCIFQDTGDFSTTCSRAAQCR
jgi:4-amino-4-deoxy-L-arabinose transferase-like glycosyltransferase